MALHVLTVNQLEDAGAEAALSKLPPLPDNVLVVMRNMQAQIDELAGRVTFLEGV
jgi:hypothetical protein